jgi:hypothetical protein
MLNLFFYHVPCGRLETRKTDHICQVQTLLPTIKWRGCVAGAEENKKKKWSKVKGEILKKKHFSGLCAIMNGRYTLTTWFTSSPCYSILLALPPPPPRRETWEQNVVFSFGLTFWTSVQQVLVQSYESLLIFGDLHGRFHILCLSSCSRTCLMGYILCDEPLVNYVLELG